MVSHIFNFHSGWRKKFICIYLDTIECSRVKRRTYIVIEVEWTPNCPNSMTRESNQEVDTQRRIRKSVFTLNKEIWQAGTILWLVRLKKKVLPNHKQIHAKVSTSKQEKWLYCWFSCDVTTWFYIIKYRSN